MTTYDLERIIEQLRIERDGGYIENHMTTDQMIQVLRKAKETIIKLRTVEQAYLSQSAPVINVYYDKPSATKEGEQLAYEPTNND